MKPPLDGIRVLDLSRVLAGPFCSMLLADHGAEVIKIEQPGKGDDTRAFGPPFVKGESAYFLSINRGKKSVTVDMKSERGKEIIRRLAEKADVVLENFRPGVAEKLGFGYEAVKAYNPRVVYASVSGFGATGPDRLKPGYDLMIQGMGGLMSITGPAGGTPCKVGASISDILAGIYAFQGILLALFHREKTGKGQRIDISMLDCVISVLTHQAQNYFSTGAAPTRRGNRHPTICPYETFEASDGYVNISVGNDKIWQGFCDLIGKGELKNDPRFQTNPKRVENHDVLFPILNEIIKTKTVAEWLKALDTAEIPAGPILTLDQVLSHPQVLAREMVVEVAHPSVGKLKLTGIPVKLSESPGKIAGAPPLLGQHTEEILESLGYTKEEISELRRFNCI
ncbi:MAG: CoA transferase [Candidatus Aureabacteria bacterium]|nr:CoA transferase [Candidatus Auribacterota bacterium]